LLTHPRERGNATSAAEEGYPIQFNAIGTTGGLLTGSSEMREKELLRVQVEGLGGTANHRERRVAVLIFERSDASWANTESGRQRRAA
jgi:hypothetical protein